MADAVATASLIENSGAASPIHCQGINTKKVQFGSLGIAGNYTTGGVQVPYNVSSFFKEIKGMIINPKDGNLFEYDSDTQKIKAKKASDGTELTNGTALNLSDIQFIAVGY
jgi:hypothetical protein